MQRLLYVLSALILLCSTSAKAEDWAEVDVSGYTRISELRVSPTISTIYYFDNKGIGLFYGGLTEETQNAGGLVSWRVWTLKWGPEKTRAVHIHVLGRVVNDIGEPLDFKSGDAGIEFRPDFNINNKIMTAVRLLWAMEDGYASRFTASIGACFEVN